MNLSIVSQLIKAICNGYDTSNKIRCHKNSVGGHNYHVS